VEDGHLAGLRFRPEAIHLGGHREDLAAGLDDLAGEIVELPEV
jgi:hypothetical protein